ncbi:Ig-like domain-containing protein, partial [Vibrio sp. UCD-FRSSP16_30]|uniref:Ig-like domain-containing protein n=1 Tax=Vibrio sp. UCD-FRSSP16_30 TaxID=1853258 RepID=UPI0012E7F71C
TGDGVINAAESSSAHIEGTAEVGATLSGLSIHDSAGNTVNISAKDMPKVDSNGHFSLDNVDVSSLTDGKLTVQVTSTDAAGNTTSASGDITLDATAGTIAINAPIAGDNWLNGTEQGQPLEISGTTSGIEDHQVVTVSFNGQDYTATVSNNAWTLSVPATDLSGIKDATPLPITANVMDAAGNPAPQASHTIDVDLSTTASISITDGSTGDGVINAAESSSAHIEGTAEVGATLSGLSIHDSAGNTVNISAKDMPKVDSNGHFSLDNVDVSSLTDGKLTVQVTSTDAAGNTTSASGDITLDATAGTI